MPPDTPQCGFLSALGFSLGLIVYLGLLAYSANCVLKIVGALLK